MYIIHISIHTQLIFAFGRNKARIYPEEFLFLGSESVRFRRIVYPCIN